MATAPRRTGPRTVSPTGAVGPVVAPNGEVVPRPIVNPADHVIWARAIARGVRADYRFAVGSQEELELEQTAYLTVMRCARKFDVGRLPDGGELLGAFRGMAAKWVRSECRREAKRLRNGGLYKTARPELVKGLLIEGLPQERCENCRDLIPGYVPPALVVYDPDPEPDAEREESMFDTRVEPGMEIPRPGKGKGKK